MDFKIVYYKDSFGNDPVDEFLIDLKRTNSRLAAQASNELRN